MVAGLANNYITSRYLGLLAFGQFSLLFSCAAYWGISGGGVGILCMRLVAQGEASSSEALCLGAILQTAFAAIILSVLMFIGVASLKDPVVYLPAILLGVTGVLQAMFNVPVLVFGGQNRMHWQSLNTLLAFAATGILLWLTRFPLALLAPTLAWLIPALVITLFTYAYIFRTPGLKVPTRGLLNKAFIQSLLLSVIPLTQIPYYHLDSLTVSWFSTGAELGILTAAMRLLTMFRQFGWVMMMAALPVLMADACSSSETLNQTFNKIILVAVLVGALLSVWTLGASNFIISLLYPADFAPAVPVLSIYAVTIVPMLIHWLAMNTLVAANRITWVGIPYILLGVVKAGVGWWLVAQWGAWGAALLSLGAEISLAAIFYGLLLRAYGLQQNRHLLGFLLLLVPIYVVMLGFPHVSAVFLILGGTAALFLVWYLIGGSSIREILQYCETVVKGRGC